MTATGDPASSADDVHRLVDMVVEEVSLVDRAANKHRFLVVKRDKTMDDNAPSAEPSDAPPPIASPTIKLEDGTALSAALTALESLTGLVEMLGSLGADQADARLDELAQGLRAVAEQLVSGIAGDDEGDDEGEDEGGEDEEVVEARAKSASGPAATPSAQVPGSFGASLAAAKKSLARLVQLTKTSARSRSEPAPVPAPSPPAPSLTEALTKLTDLVQQQQLRLGHLEKQFGAPNSTTAGEHLPSATESDDEGWPLDLNKPRGRSSVDKAISFHDL